MKGTFLKVNMLFGTALFLSAGHTPKLTTSSVLSHTNRAAAWPNCKWKTILCTKDCCLLYTSDAADEEDSVDLGGRRIIKKKNK